MTKYQCFKCGNTYLDGESCSYCYLADSNKKALENLADRIEISQQRHADEMRNSLINVATATAVVGARLKSEGEMTDEDAYKAGYQLENFRYEIFESIFDSDGFIDLHDIEEKFKPDYLYKNLQRHYIRGVLDYLRSEFAQETSIKIRKEYKDSLGLYPHEVWTGFLEDSYKNGYAWNSNFKLFSNITLWGRYYIAGSKMNFESYTPPVIIDDKTQTYLLNIKPDSSPFSEILKSRLKFKHSSEQLWNEYLRGVNDRLNIENKPNIVQQRLKAKSQEAMNRAFVYFLTGLIYLLPIFLVAWLYFS